MSYMTSERINSYQDCVARWNKRVSSRNTFDKDGVPINPSGSLRLHRRTRQSFEIKWWGQTSCVITSANIMTVHHWRININIWWLPFTNRNTGKRDVDRIGCNTRRPWHMPHFAFDGIKFDLTKTDISGSYKCLNPKPFPELPPEPKRNPEKYAAYLAGRNALRTAALAHWRIGSFEKADPVPWEAVTAKSVATSIKTGALGPIYNQLHYKLVTWGLRYRSHFYAGGVYQMGPIEEEPVRRVFKDVLRRVDSREVKRLLGVYRHNKPR